MSKLSNPSVKQVHLILSTDLWLEDELINNIINQHGITKPEISRWTWKNQAETELKIITKINTRDFFVQNQILIINCESLDKSSDAKQKLLLKSLAKTQHLIILIVREKLSAKWLKQLTPLVTMWETKKVTLATKRSFIKKYFKDHHVVFELSVIEYLINNFPNNLTLISKELEKICLYWKDQPQILTIDLAKKIINIYPNQTIFPLIEDLLIGNPEAIIASYHKLQRPITPLFLSSVLQTYLLWIKKIFAWKKQQLSNHEIIAKKPDKRFFMIKLLNLYQKINEQYLDQLIDKLYHLEYNFKVSDINKKSFLELFLVK